MLSTTATYLSVATNIARRQAATAAEPAVKAATAHFLANIGGVKTARQFVNDYPLFSYAMKAYGLSDMTFAKGLMLKVLAGGVSGRGALANTLSDPRYKAFATAFDFAGQGAQATAAVSASSGAAARYIEQTLEDDQAKSNQGVANALYFKRNAASVTSVYGILADPKILKVVETAYGLSSSLGASDIDTQAKVLSRVLDINDLQNPSKVERLVERYTSRYDASNAPHITSVLLVDPTETATGVLAAANGQSTIAPDSVLNLFNAGSSSQTGLSSSLLLSIANLPRGG